MQVWRKSDDEIAGMLGGRVTNCLAEVAVPGISFSAQFPRGRPIHVLTMAD